MNINAEMNNVIVKHKAHTISIAQHSISGRNSTQEIMVWGPEIPFEDGIIFNYSSNGPMLLEALQEAIDYINKTVSAE